jgi:hypothetical protein
MQSAALTWVLAAKAKKQPMMNLLFMGLPSIRKSCW